MAVINTFLKLMVEKRAERLVLVADAVPYLLKAGETIQLSMPALRRDMLLRICQEITGQSNNAHADRTLLEGSFLGSDGGDFAYNIHHPTGPELRIELQTLGPPPAPEPVPDLSELMAGNVSALPPVKPRGKTAPTNPPAPAKGPTVAETPPAPPSGRVAASLLAVIGQAVYLEASDIFLSAGKPPRMRRNGAITPIDADAPSAAQLLELLPGEAARLEFEQTGNADFAARWEMADGNRRFRINLFRHLNGIAAAIRPIRQRIPSPAELNLHESILDLTSFPSGLVLVTGPSGSGKSTTLAALIDHINRTRPRHVLTIEDPIEFEHREIQCLIHQREVGTDVDSFSNGLRASLRENPDVILLGELRDLDTISAALTAAETGHLVLATLHSGSATAAISRIVDIFPGHQQPFIRLQLSTSLRAVVSQRLIPTRARALVPALEKLMVTPAVANGIREGHEHHLRNAMLTGTEDGMITLERSLSILVRKGIIDRETAARHAVDQKALAHLME